jgi:hypothetical protein
MRADHPLVIVKCVDDDLLPWVRDVQIHHKEDVDDPHLAPPLQTAQQTDHTIVIDYWLKSDHNIALCALAILATNERRVAAFC